MSDIKFSCPSCQQRIQAEEGYAGMQINCPACNSPLTVPGLAAPARPVLATPGAVSAPTPSPPGLMIWIDRPNCWKSRVIGLANRCQGVWECKAIWARAAHAFGY